VNQSGTQHAPKIRITRMTYAAIESGGVATRDTGMARIPTIVASK
jgi:hypothetical protein